MKALDDDEQYQVDDTLIGEWDLIRAASWQVRMTDSNRSKSVFIDYHSWHEPGRMETTVSNIVFVKRDFRYIIVH